jgi:hypothetical protein
MEHARNAKPMIFSHDQAFKNLILDYPREAIRFFAPSEAEGIDEAVQILPLRQEQLKERLGERFRELDTPLLVDWGNGRREAIIFMFEEHTESGRFNPFKFAHYCLDIAELQGTRRVVPVLILLHPGEYPVSLEIGSEHATFLQFHYLHCALWKLDSSHYLNSDNLVARLNLPLMHHTPNMKLAVYHQALTGLLDLEKRVEWQRKYWDFIDYYANLDEADLTTYEQEYLLRSQQRDTIMGAFQQRMEKVKEEYWSKGLAEGLAEGIAEGETQILLRLASRRFGALPSWAEDRIRGGNKEQLESWADRLLDASSLDDVFQG